MLKILENLKYTPLYETILPLTLRLELRRWHKHKKFPPTPQLIKHKVIREIAKKYSTKILVETGTYLGTMINANKSYFERIFTVELDKKLYKRAKKKFARFRHITVKQGDSAKVLPQILKEIKDPTLFWLDAHYSGGITSKGKLATPIFEELKIILTKSSSHVLLIDDALDFNGQNDYPDIKKLKGIIAKKNPNYKFLVKENIIYILPI